MLIYDNVAYHQARAIGLLDSIRKIDLITLCLKHSIEYINLSMSSACQEYTKNSQTVPIEILDAYNAEDIGLKATANNHSLDSALQS